MKGKITTIIGIFILVLAAITYILFESHVKTESNLSAVNVVVANQDIKSDFVVANEQIAQELFTIRRVSVDDVVSGAVTVSSTQSVDNSLFTQIKSFFIPETPDKSQLSQLVGLKLTRAYSKNEQILSSYVSTDIMEFKEDERVFVPDGLVVSSTMATELHKGDYVDLWIVTKDEITKEISSSRFCGPLKIYKIKDADSNELTGNATSPSVGLLFKLSNDDIKNISSKMYEKETYVGCFVTKYGAQPSEDNLEVEFFIDMEETDNSFETNMSTDTVEINEEVENTTTNNETTVTEETTTTTTVESNTNNQDKSVAN